MKKSLIALAIAGALTGGNSQAAMSDAEWRAAMEQRLSYLEQRVRAQDQVIEQKNQEIAELRESSSASVASGWFQNTEIGGVIEVEAGRSSGGGASEDDMVTGTVELGIATQVNPWVSAELVLLYEEDTDNADENGSNAFSVDTAVVSIADPDSNWFINAGQYTLPFGAFPTNMVSDPLTLDMAETADTAAEFGASFGAFTASAFVFDGDRGTSADIDNYGFALVFENQTDTAGIVAHAAWLNDIGETDGLGGVVNAGDGDMAGWIASAEVTFGNFVLIGEYFAALDDFKASAPGDEPSAYNLEAGVNFELAGLPTVFAVAHQKTSDMQTLDNSVVETRNGAAVTFEVLDGTSVGVEYLSEEAHDGSKANTLTGKLAVEF